MKEEKRILEIIAYITGHNIEDLEDKLQLLGMDLAIDSLDAVELIIEFEKAFNIHINDDEAFKCETIQDVINLIGKTINK